MCKRTDAGVQLEEQRQRLANSTSSAEDRDFRQLAIAHQLAIIANSCVTRNWRRGVCPGWQRARVTHVSGRSREGSGLEGAGEGSSCSKHDGRMDWGMRVEGEEGVGWTRGKLRRSDELREILTRDACWAVKGSGKAA